MSNKKKSTGLWRGLTSVSASLLAVTVGASAIVDTNGGIYQCTSWNFQLQDCRHK